MRAMERKSQIMKYLQEHGSADCSVLAEMFAVSTMTIRRDLSKLEEEGLVIVEYGGAILNDGVTYEHSMQMKQSEYKEEKMRIAARCEKYINEGDTIFLDAGTTVYELAKLLSKRKNITVMTHSLLVANALADSEIEVIMCPGQYREKSRAFMGPLTDGFIANFCVDKLFLAVEGMDHKGVSVPNVVDGTTKKNLIRHAKWTCCMADASKLDTRYYYNIAQWDEIDVLVTNEEHEVYNNLKEYIKV